MRYGKGQKKRGQRGRVKMGLIPSLARADAIKKAKKTGVNYQNGEGVRQKKMTFLGDPARKSGGITPRIHVSHNQIL